MKLDMRIAHYDGNDYICYDFGVHPESGSDLPCWCVRVLPWWIPEA